ncbi:tigger transposable element-derived protein 6-like [Ixodes scapularis]|uniref:tigger transposable element-derived protein 6-like n=1 Tax=Ixodes scapularis TaxID=6945 RepID=UPI001AD7111F|nr:tigger transposable element-derived protein 6-like [Ixodes scapularis]
MIEQACNDVLMTSSCSRTRQDMALLFLAFCRGGSLFFVSFLFPQEMATKVRSSLPFSTKVEIIRRVERGEKKSEVAASFKIARSTLSTILKNKPAILQKSRDRPNADGKRIRAPAFDRVEKALYAWFLDIRARNLPVSGPMLQQKAKDFAFLLDVQDFSGGSGWLQRFKERYDIVGKVVAGESRAVDNESVKKWIAENWPAITEQYRPCDIYNTDETALFWQLLPSRTLARQGEKCHGGKLNKARITVLLTTNMDGSSKLTPLIIGKSKAPMCLRGCRSLPVKYTSNGKAWMTRVLFEDWLRDWDEKLSESGRKICLLLDNCSAHHCGATLKNIQLRFLPPNATSVLQPLDQGIIRAFKQGYRKRVVEQLLTKLRVGKELKIDLLGAIEMLSRAWSDIAPNTIKNCFRHAGLSLDNDRASTEEAIEVTDDDLNEMWRDLGRLPDAVPDGVELEDFLGVDDDVAVTSSPSDNEIVAEVVAASANDDDDEEAEDPEAPCPTLHEALAATEVLRRYCSQLQGSGLSLVNQLSRVEDEILKDAVKAKTQAKITSFCR